MPLKIVKDGVDITDSVDATLSITTPPPPAFGIDGWGTAPESGELKGAFIFRVTGFFENVELVPSGKYDPKYGRVTLAADRRSATVEVDPADMADGTYQLVLKAFDRPAGQPAQEKSTDVRTWIVRNAPDEGPADEDEDEDDVVFWGEVVDRDQTVAPAGLMGPPRNFLAAQVEDWSSYPLGDVEQFDPAQWYDAFSHGSEFLNGGREQGVYVTPKTRARGVDYYPHKMVQVDGRRALAITPRLTPASEKDAVYGYPVESGVVTSRKELTYAYYEAELKLPSFRGAWSAMWFMGPSWWPEFDMLEHVPHAMGGSKFHTGTHTQNPATGKDVGAGAEVTAQSELDEWFTLAGLWTPKFVATYLNGQLVWEKPNVASATNKGLHDPAHLLFSLAIVGKATDSWGGPVTVDASTPLSPLYVGKVRVYAMP